ncbi:hypothetical protein [Microbacterium sp.]|uniref:hypothetical protein n=1 Tax=Microbacterium sp. TaxID=51671 RepID=UPI003458F266
MNSAAAVKKTVCVAAISVDVASSSRSIVTSAGLSMLALSWKARHAARRAIISDTTLVRVRTAST